MNLEAKRWYILYTRPKAEKKVADLLTKKKIDHLYAQNRLARLPGDRKRVLTEPLFSSYVFVNVLPSHLHSLTRMDGVVHVIYWLGAPAEIKHEEIEAIKEFLAVYQNIRAEKTAVNMNEKATMTTSPVVKQNGAVMLVKNKYASLSLPSLGYIIKGEVGPAPVDLTESSGSSIQGFIRRQWRYAFG